MANSIARTSLAFYIRDELQAVMRARRRNEVCLRLACRSGRDAGLASSTMEQVSDLLHRGETTWQQRRGADVKKPAHGKAPAESRAARAARGRLAAARAGVKRARVRAVKRQALLYERKSRHLAGFFAFTTVNISRWRAPLSGQSGRRTQDPISARRGRIRSSLPGSSLDWPR
jgi:hypothetical protein